MTKLNNKGWGLGTFIVGIGVFAICLLIVVILVHNGAQVLEPNYNPNNELNSEYDYNYSKLEDKVIIATKNYVNDKYNNIVDDDTLMTLTIKKLQKDNYLDTLYDLKNTNKKCSGYITFYKKDNQINYQPYINCKNYKTYGYEERYDDN